MQGAVSQPEETQESEQLVGGAVLGWRPTCHYTSKDRRVGHKAEIELSTCPGTTGVGWGWGAEVWPLLGPYSAFALVGFPLKQPCRALVEHQILPAEVGQANPQRCLFVHREWTDHVHPR